MTKTPAAASAVRPLSRFAALPLTALLLGGVALGQSATPAAPAAAPAATRVQVGNTETAEQAYGRWVAAVNSRNTERVLSVYAPNALLLPTVSRSILRDQATRKPYFDGLLTRTNFMVTPRETLTQVLSDSLAVVSGTYEFSFQDGNTTTRLPSRFNFVFQKLNGVWYIVNHHSAVLPN